MNGKKERVLKIASAIKRLKIQGATSVAKAALKAYYLMPNKKNKERLLNLRPTEPMLMNVLDKADKIPKEKILKHFEEAQNKINVNVYRVIKKNKVIFTHCHSTNVEKALIYAKIKGVKFEVYNTETRPLYQGRITARRLSKAGIKVTTFVDSAMHEAIKKSNLVLIGSDAILKSGIINKIGSAAIAEIAFIHKKPLYVVADSWKFSPKNIRIEERDFHEVWKNSPRKIKVRNPAFEKVERKYVRAVVSELGLLKFDRFIRLAG